MFALNIIIFILILLFGLFLIIYAKNIDKK